ncbi:MAG: RNA methyltransferase [Cytophagales bacterium]|nr:RNA methyltransferase [Bernardetiaceae bacterium]MDW8210183.1 RNA methyltransferase [Cytophagales bacterium]
MRKLSIEELSRIDALTYRQYAHRDVVMVLDNVRSALNVGSVFRTADAFGIERLYLCGITATPPHREINKTALGAQQSVAWEYFADTDTCLQHLKQKGFRIVVVEQTDQKILLHEFIPQPQTQYAFVFGNEATGVSDSAIHLADLALEIPQFGTKHSFNIAVTTGIVMWHYFLHKRQFFSTQVQQTP